MGLKEIANEAGVSISTVSHVLNGTASISREVHDRVLSVARQMGYLEKRRHKATISTLSSVILATPENTLPADDSNIVYWTVLNTLKEDCQTRNIRVQPVVTPGRRIGAAAVRKAIEGHVADGLIVLHDDSAELVSFIRKLSIPAVLLNGQDPYMTVDSVSPANRFAAWLGTNWLIGRGHRNIVHVTWGERRTIRQRMDGFREAMQDASIELTPDNFLTLPGFLRHEAETAIKTWLDKNDGLGDVTAFFCASDDVAIGLLNGLAEAGYAVPKDVSVMGCDGALPGEFSDPPLTTVALPLKELGAAALNMLEERLRDPSENRLPRRLELGAEIVERNSVKSLK